MNYQNPGYFNNTKYNHVFYNVSNYNYQMNDKNLADANKNYFRSQDTKNITISNF